MSESERKVVLVTGSATGVGRACAVKFASMGFDVVVNYPGVDEEEAKETVRLVEAEGMTALLSCCDVSRDDEVVAMLAATEKVFGHLDVLVNAAGATAFVKHDDLQGLSEAQWDSILAVNTKGPFFVTRAAVPLLEGRKGATVVNVSSVAGISGFGSSIAYCASKGALNTMTRSLARALAPKIRVNAVCPGPIDSRWLRQDMSEEEISDRVSTFPIPRLSSPGDIADTVTYLAMGTAMTTGQILVVDGGRTI